MEMGQKVPFAFPVMTILVSPAGTSTIGGKKVPSPFDFFSFCFPPSFNILAPANSLEDPASTSHPL